MKDETFVPDAALPVILRPMRAADVRSVARLDRRAFPQDSWSEASFRAEVSENPLARYVVATDPAGVVMGYAGTWVLPGELHLVTIGVDPGWQGRGLGAALVLRVFALAAECEAESITLECRESNRPARGLYAQFGFEQTGRRRRYYADGEDALILTARGIGTPAFQHLLAQRRRAVAKRVAVQEP